MLGWPAIPKLGAPVAPPAFTDPGLPCPTSLDKSKIKFLLLEGLHPPPGGAARRRLQPDRILSGALPQDELIQRIADVHFIGIRSRTQPTAEGGRHAKARAIGCFCIGTNQGPERRARARHRRVQRALFQHPLGGRAGAGRGHLAAARHAREKRRGAPRRLAQEAENAYEIRGKTLGIVGYGSIGTQLSVLAEALGMQVIFHDVVAKLPLGNARQAANLHDLLAQSDIVSLHVPELPSTSG
jgi:D-3-phosphoglycerate dehydrogenase